MNGINRPLIKPQRRLVSVTNLNIRHCIYYIHIECREWIPCKGKLWRQSPRTSSSPDASSSPRHPRPESTLYIYPRVAAVFFASFSFFFTNRLHFYFFWHTKLIRILTNCWLTRQVFRTGGSGADQSQTQLLGRYFFFGCVPCFVVDAFFILLTDCKQFNSSSKTGNPTRKLSSTIYLSCRESSARHTLPRPLIKLILLFRRLGPGLLVQKD